MEFSAWRERFSDENGDIHVFSDSFKAAGDKQKHLKFSSESFFIYTLKLGILDFRVKF